MKQALLGQLALACGALGIEPIITKAEPGFARFGDSKTSKSGIVMIDAGSSGSKVFAFFGPKHEKGENKLLTKCQQAEVEAGETNKGVAALAYPKAECHWQVGPKDQLKPLVAVNPGYVDALLGLLKQTYLDVSQQKDLSQLANGGSVPMLATAGMRLISQVANDNVWGQVCGKHSAGLTLAAYGEECGTIPGTTEAYYEYLANAANGNGERVLTGTFTVGGASAQIAIPLKSEQDVQDFLAMKAAIASELDCTKLVLEDGSPAPIFSLEHPAAAKEACINDYVTIRPKSQIKASTLVLNNNVKVQELQGLGLVSFLSLRGRGTFLAGGLNEIGLWAKEVGCNTKTTSFEDCSKKLRTELRKDVIWKHVTEFFRTHFLGIRSFSYNTYAATPAASGMLKDKSQHDPQVSAWRLGDALKEECGKDNGLRFGYKGSNSCLQAYYTSLYATSFFAEAHEQSLTQHTSTELHSDPGRDWSEGKFQTLALDQADARFGTASMLLNEPLQLHSAGFLEGALLHMMSKRHSDVRSVGKLRAAHR